MSSTREGGLKARDKNLAKDPQFYQTIGSIGGKLSHDGGFAQGEEGRARASYWGKIGGALSRRPPNPTSLANSDKQTTCTFCHQNGHRAHACLIRLDKQRRREQLQANLAVRNEQHEIDRERMKRMAEKHAVRRPW
jgi:general stress protein YciG